MVLTKSYLRYVDAGNFGVIGSAKANVCLVKCWLKQERRRERLYYAIVPAIEDVYVWDVRTGDRVRLYDCKSLFWKFFFLTIVFSPLKQEWPDDIPLKIILLLG